MSAADRRALRFLWFITAVAALGSLGLLYWLALLDSWTILVFSFAFIISMLALYRLRPRKRENAPSRS